MSRHGGDNKHLLICSAGLPGSGTTLLSCLLSRSLFKDAIRIRVRAGVLGARLQPDDLDPGPGISLPHDALGAHYEINWSLPIQRAWLVDLIQEAPQNARFVLDVSAGNPRQKSQPVTRLLAESPFLSDHQVDLMMMVKPDMGSVYRARSSVAQFDRPGQSNIRLTAVFNNAAGGYEAERTEWECMWRQWARRTVVDVEGRLQEVRLPNFSQAVLDHCANGADDLGISASAATDTITSMEAVRWQKAVDHVRDLFSFLEKPAKQ